MALVLNDRVKETSTTTGVGAMALGGAATGFETFAAGVGNSNTTYYAIWNQGTSEWEVGLGTLDVFCTMPASKSVYLDSSGNPVGAASAGFALAMAVAL